MYYHLKIAQQKLTLKRFSSEANNLCYHLYAESKKINQMNVY